MRNSLVISIPEKAKKLLTRFIYNSVICLDQVRDELLMIFLTRQNFSQNNVLIPDVQSQLFISIEMD